MKTFVRLIRRYVLAAVGIVVLLLFLGIGLIAWLGWREGQRLPRQTYDSAVIADAMIKTEDTLTFGAEHTPEEWMDGYAWAMVLDDQGHVNWSYGLPEALDKTYTPSDIASFTRWYLYDYPVFCMERVPNSRITEISSLTLKRLVFSTTTISSSATPSFSFTAL